VDRYVDDVVTVTDDEIAQAIVLLLERSKLVVQGAGARLAEGFGVEVEGAST
jgi:threonine dehydratase